jgi:hypothetical protein
MFMTNGISKSNNPFATESWIKQECSFTPHRADQIVKHDLFGKTEAEIKNIKKNDGKYPAYIAIRRGYAVMKNGKFRPTQKWDDEYGHLRPAKETIEPSPPEIKSRAQATSPPRSDSPDLKSLVGKLRRFDPEPVINAYKQNDLKWKSPAKLFDFTFGPSIYRAFRHESPTRRYRKWRWYKKPYDLLEKMDGLQNQEAFDRLAYDVAGSLVDDWGDTKDNGKPTYMNEGIAMKITNLLLKHLAFSKHTDNARLQKWLHVPWDKFTLKPLRDIWPESPSIPANPSQGFVRDLDLYRDLHDFITRITDQAEVMRITYEFWAWDKSH